MPGARRRPYNRPAKQPVPLPWMRRASPNLTVKNQPGKTVQTNERLGRKTANAVQNLPSRLEHLSSRS